MTKDLVDGYDSDMFGLGKKKEPVILGGSRERVPGMPEGLYSSRDVENLRFHDKRRVWYNAKQVDDALDKVQATLEWWEAKSGWKPSSKGLAAESDGDAVAGGPLDVTVPEALADNADTGAADSKQKDETVVVPGKSALTGSAYVVDGSGVETPTAGQAPDAIAVQTDATVGEDEDDERIDPLTVAPVDHDVFRPAAAVSSEGYGIAPRVPTEVPTFNLGLAAGKPAGGDETDGMWSTGAEDHEASEAAAAYAEDHADSEISVEDKVAAAKTLLGELAAIAGKADSDPVAPITPISMPPVPAVPSIPVNPFLRRK